MDSPWDENADNNVTRDTEWEKISSEFTNAGYREGITAGKEAAAQEGFDVGFADVGVPIGRQLGALRGNASALLALLKSPHSAFIADASEKQSMLAEARDIVAHLGNIRFADIVPRDLEAEEHARQHLAEEDQEMEVNEEIAEKRKMEGIEDMLANLTAGSGANTHHTGRPTVDDLQKLRKRLQDSTARLGLELN